jgi:hypothetical protein
MTSFVHHHLGPLITQRVQSVDQVRRHVVFAGIEIFAQLLQLEDRVQLERVSVLRVEDIV